MFNLKSVFQGLCSKIFGSDKSNHSSRPILTVPTIRDAALSYDGKFNVQDIVDITGKSRGSIGEILRELRDKNILVKYKDGTWEKVEINPVVINWGIPEIGTSQSVITDGKALNNFIRSTILSKTKAFTIPSLKAQLRLDRENGRIQRIVYKLVKEGLIVNTGEKDLTYLTPPYLYKVVKKGV